MQFVYIPSLMRAGHGPHQLRRFSTRVPFVLAGNFMPQSALAFSSTVCASHRHFRTRQIDLIVWDVTTSHTPPA